MFVFLDQDKICNFERGLPIDASYQVLVYLAEQFQRRILKCKRLMDNRQRTADAK